MTAPAAPPGRKLLTQHGRRPCRGSPDTLKKSVVLWHTPAGGSPAKSWPDMPCERGKPATRKGPVLPCMSPTTIGLMALDWCSFVPSARFRSTVMGICLEALHMGSLCLACCRGHVAHSCMQSVWLTVLVPVECCNNYTVRNQQPCCFHLVMSEWEPCDNKRKVKGACVFSRAPWIYLEFMEGQGILLQAGCTLVRQC